MSDEVVEYAPKKKGLFERAVTNEGTLFVYRFIVTAASVGLLYYANKINGSNETLLAAFNQAKLEAAGAMAALDGKITTVDGKTYVLNSRLDAQAERITSVTVDIRTLYTRFYDLVSRPNPQR